MSGENKAQLSYWILLSFLLIACTQPKNRPAAADPLNKIRFDLSLLNEDGLYGPPDGLQELSYEFCIPAGEGFVSEVHSIDSTLSVLKDSHGRIGCSESEYLCLGNTHRKNFREVLLKLAGLPYVKKIEESFFEY